MAHAEPTTVTAAAVPAAPVADAAATPAPGGLDPDGPLRPLPGGGGPAAPPATGSGSAPAAPAAVVIPPGPVPATAPVTPSNSAAGGGSDNAAVGGGSGGAIAGAAVPMARDKVLLSIKQPDGAETLGVRTAAGVVDVRTAARTLRMPAPLTLEQLLRRGRAADALDALVAAALENRVGLVDEKAVTHGRLLTRPGKIVCVGLNYRRHAEEVGAEPPRVPPLFNKYNNALAAHNSTVVLPKKDVAFKIDYETELLVVIGKAARDVPEEEALDYVAGYAVGHDLSARDLQLELPAGQWMIGKTLDGFAPIGPYFVGADLVKNPNDLRLETLVNGETVQSWSTSDFIFDVQKVISYVSKHWTLEAGDIIFTGTPQGVILGRAKADQHWLKAGDEIVSRIEHLGELRFRLA